MNNHCFHILHEPFVAPWHETAVKLKFPRCYTFYSNEWLKILSYSLIKHLLWSSNQVICTSSYDKSRPKSIIIFSSDDPHSTSGKAMNYSTNQVRAQCSHRHCTQGITRALKSWTQSAKSTLKHSWMYL